MNFELYNNAMRLTARQREILDRVCEAFVPRIENESDGPLGEFWRRKGSDLPAADLMLEFISAQGPRERRDFCRLLDLMGSRLLGLSWAGPLRPFDRLAPEQQARLLKSWRNSRFNLFRQGFATLKGLSLFAFYACCPGEGDNPNWEAIGYPGGQPRAEVERPSAFAPLRLEGSNELTCQALVIGSGAGGGVVAGELAEAGLDVIIAEKGPYVAETAFTNREAEMIPRLYEGAGAMASRDGGVNILAGSCLGGGTTVNWAGSFRTPEYVLREWAELYDLPHFLEGGYQRSMDAVSKAIGVTTSGPRHNPQNQALWDASMKSGHPVAAIPRNIRGCPEPDGLECGYCGYGCRSGSKQSALRTYLRRAAAAGARILADCEIDRILIEGGRAVGAEGAQRLADGRKAPLRIRAGKVVASAGAIHTPALLRRSGLKNRWIGRVLYLHPTVAVSGFYPRPIRSWWGPMMSAVNNRFTNLDGAYGFKLETPPVHCGFYAFTIPWDSGRRHKQLMLDSKRAAHFIVLTRDRYGGRIEIDRNGRPRVRYRVHRYDLRHMLRGLAEAARLHWEAGAERILFHHNDHYEFSSRRSFEEAAEKIASWGWKSNRHSLFSAHQMSTCRMAGSPRQGAARPTGESWEAKNLYIADASALPKCSGVNPMLTIMSVARQIARRILDAAP